MRLTLAFLFPAILSLLASSCGNVPSSPAPEQPCASYNDTLYCFNGRSIVHLDGLAGLIDDSGHLLLAPEWLSIEFLDDETALLQGNGRYCLCTKDGRVFAESVSQEELEQNSRELLARMQDSDIRLWDNILDRLDDLCSLCISRAPNKEILASYAALKELLSQAEAPMTASQQTRFEDTVRRFNTFARR